MNGYDKYLKQVESKANRGDKLSFSRSQFSNKKTISDPQNNRDQRFNRDRRFKQDQQIKRDQQVKPKKRIPMLSVVFSLIGFFLALWGYENQPQLDKWINSIEISFTTKSFSKEASSEPAHLPEKKEPDAVEGAVKPQESKLENDIVDFNFIKDFQERKKQLDLKEEELKKLESEIVSQRENIDKKLDEVENIRKKITQQLEDRVKADEQKIDTLVQVYSQMKPPQAAKVFESIDEDLAVEVLTKMKKKNAAEILNLLKPERAQSLSEKFAGYRRKPSSTGSEAKNSETRNNEELKNVNSKKP